MRKLELSGLGNVGGRRCRNRSSQRRRSLPQLQERFEAVELANDADQKRNDKAFVPQSQNYGAASEAPAFAWLRRGRRMSNDEEMTKLK
jgi:hypothetical protein